MTIDDPRAALVALAERQGTSLAALSAMLGRNTAYLQQFVGRGSPRLLAERDRRILADYFGVSETVLGALRDRAAPFRVPRLDIAASAGPGALVDTDLVVGSDLIDPALAARLGLRDGAAAMLRVRGSSMEPGLLDGDQILIDTNDRTPRGKAAIYVIRIDGTTMVKRVALERGRIVARSDNPASPPVPEGAIAVVGRVVWLMRAPR